MLCWELERELWRHQSRHMLVKSGQLLSLVMSPDGKRLPSSVDSSNFFIKFFLMRDYVQQKNNGCCLQSTAGRGTLPIFCDRQPACPPWRLGYYIPMANIPNYSFEDTKYLSFFFFNS